MNAELSKQIGLFFRLKAYVTKKLSAF